MVYVDEYVELDEDNDLIESLKKGTMDEDDYDESYRNWSWYTLSNLD